MNERERVAAVILAAGASTRFGSPKQLAMIGERTLLGHVVEIARTAGLDPIIAVIAPNLAPPSGVVAVVNSDAAAGLSRSLQLGIAAVSPSAGAAVVLLGDQPTLDPAVVAGLVAARTDRPIVAARAEGRLGPPVLIRRSGFALVDEAAGDVGLRAILSARPELVEPIEVGSHAPDMDHPDDVARLGR
jgi:molybdenum cofactor cytidylyltransferase